MNRSRSITLNTPPRKDNKTPAMTYSRSSAAMLENVPFSNAVILLKCKYLKVCSEKKGRIVVIKWGLGESERVFQRGFSDPSNTTPGLANSQFELNKGGSRGRGSERLTLPVWWFL